MKDCHEDRSDTWSDVIYPRGDKETTSAGSYVGPDGRWRNIKNTVHLNGGVIRVSDHFIRAIGLLRKRTEVIGLLRNRQLTVVKSEW